MRRIFAHVAFAMVGLVVPASAPAQSSYPSRPIQLVVGYAAGGPTDVTARVLAQELTQSLAQPVVVVNKAGAASLIATKK
jgi:tripartite-type tricarboxylate transporter receptor subunit TctC